MRDLYELNMRVMLAAATTLLQDGVFLPEDTRRVTSIDILFAAIASSTNNSALIQLVESLNDRMKRIRRAEHSNIPGIDREIDIMSRLFRRGEGAKLRRSIIAYHRRRMKACPRISARLQHQSWI